MAPIAFVEIINSSSEDSRFPAQNLLQGEKWLTDPKDTSGKATIEFQLNKASRINYIDIGYSNVSSLEVSVGRSSWPASREYCTILSTVMLQTAQEGRSAKNKTGCRMFNCPEHLNPEYANEWWDRVRINLTQKFAKNKQLGLEFVRFGSPKNAPENDEQDLQNPGPSSNSWKNSQIARLSKTTCQKPKELHDLEDKLLRISGTTEGGSSEQNTLRRTAKMVLSSRSGNLISQNVKSPLRRGGDFNLLSAYRSTSSSRPLNNSVKIFEKSVDEQPNTTVYSSPHIFKTNTSLKSSAGARTLDKECGATVECKEAAKVDKIPVSPKSSFSKLEIKRIKNLIQKYFNTLDMEQMDPDNVTLKELRISFEAIHNVQLDEDGRQYFRRITADYLELAMTVRQHKGLNADDSLMSVKGTSTLRRKRKPEECLTLPALNPDRGSTSKSLRISQNLDEPGTSLTRDREIVSTERKEVQCPICMGYFPQSFIFDHAAVCGEDEETNNPQIDSDLEITSVSSPRQQIDSDLEITSVSSPRQQRFSGETFLDLTDNMKLSEEEKRYWLNFSQKPKPYHPRMDKNLFRGCQLTKCPTCGQFYKTQEISEHSDECAEKVFSGLEKRGLYYVRKDNGKVVKTPK